MAEYSQGELAKDGLRKDVNINSFLRIGIFCAAALACSVLVPRELLGTTLSSILAIASATSALTGVLASDRVFSDHMTRWDEAAILLMIGIAVGALTGASADASITA